MTVLPLNDIILNFQDDSSLSYDDILFNYCNGGPSLRNIIFSVLLQTSNSLTTIRKNEYAGVRNNNPKNAHKYLQQTNHYTHNNYGRIYR